MQPIYDFGGNGPVINLAIANGFPPQTYHPLVDPLTAHYRVVCLLPRPLWGEPPPTRLINWRDLIATDLVDGLREHNLQDVILMGHSFGGVASMIAALESPRVRALILLDPTIFPDTFNWMMRFSQMVSDGRLGNPMVERAEKRRDRFESKDAAFARFQNKGPFADWHTDALRGYADSMIPTGDGEVTLAWSKAWESYIFRSFYVGSWKHVPQLRGRVPVLVIRGEKSRTFMPPAGRRFRQLLPEATYAEIPDHGHLFPQSAPDATRTLITDWLNSTK